MKNLRIVLIVIVFIVIAGFIGSAVRSYYLFLKEPVSPIVNALPLNTAIIIKTSFTKQLLDAINNSSASNLFDYSKGDYAQITRWVDSISLKNESLADLLEDNEVVFALVPGENKKPHLLIVTTIGKTGTTSLHKSIKSMFNNEYYSIVSDENSIYRIENEKSKLWYYIKQGVLAISTDKETITQSLATLTSDSTFQLDTTFVKLNSTGGKRVDAVVMINNRNMVNAVWPSMTTWMLGETPFNQWTTLDLNIKEKEVLLGGFTLTSNKHLFDDQQPGDFDQLIDYPSNTAFAITLTMSDQKKYTSHFTHSDTLHVKGYDSSIESKTTEIFRPGEHLKEWIGNSISLVLQKGYFNGNKDDKIVLVKNKNENAAKLYLSPYIQPIEDSIGIMHYNSFTNALWGNLFKLSGTVYCMITSKNVVFSPSIIAIRAYRNQITSNTSQKLTQELARALEYAGKSSNIFIYTRPDVISNWFMKADHGKGSNEWMKILSKTSQLGLQLSSGEKLQYTHSWLLPLNPGVKNQSVVMEEEKEIVVLAVDKTDEVHTKEPVKETLHQSASAGTRPPQVVNGNNKSGKQIATFTKDNKLNMHDHLGKLTWSFKLKESPLSTVFEIDFNRSGKIHYVVATRNYLHIINQDGKEVNSSPVKLPSELLGGLSVFDYDKKKDYRLLYIGTNHLVYNITLEGIVLPDWQKPKVNSVGYLTFIRSNGKDHIIFKGSDEVRIFDRRGKERIKVGSNFMPSVNAGIFENKTNSKGLFVTVNIDGELTYINNNGIISTSTFGTLSRNPWFNYIDFDSDGSTDFIFASNNRLTVYSRMKQEIRSTTTKDGNYGKPFIYSSSNNVNWIFVRNIKTGEVTGFNNKKETFTKSIISDTDPVVFNLNGSLSKILVTTSKGKLVLTQFN